MNGNYKILMVLIALATIVGGAVGGAFAYDRSIDTKIEKAMFDQKELTKVNYDAIWRELVLIRKAIEKQ